jgi:hypothetical protein
MIKQGLIFEDVKKKEMKKYKPRKCNYKEVNFYAFGKFILNRKRLNDENILLIKYPVSNAPIPKIKRTPITDEFKNLINDLLDTKKINIETQKKLTKKEADLFELLLRLSGLTDHLNYTRVSKDINDYKKRFEVLQGSLNAGNDSDIIIDELKEIILLLSNKTVGIISLEDKQMLLECLE